MRALRIILIFVALSLLTAGGIFYFLFRGFGKDFSKERLVVKLGSTDDQVIDDLKEKGFIRNKKVFSFVLNAVCWQRKSCPESGKRLSPGAYHISKSMNVYEVAGVFLYGPFQKWVVIPPGKRKEQVAIILKKSLDWPDDMAFNFIKVAQEGYLWPDSYLFNTDSDPSQIAKRLESEFNVRLGKLENDLLKQKIRTDTAVLFASLIERESGGKEDKPIIAGIIWNRLEKKMKLEIDATVQYAIASSKFKIPALPAGRQSSKLSGDFSFWEFLPSNTVRKIDSPYNTYLIKGLPPGPICSPSIESIRAVAYPAQTDALYYLHSPDKQIHTAKTYKEHQENIKKYLQ